MVAENPYSSEDPISRPEQFFGRQDIFREIMQVLLHPQNNAIVLLGQLHMGKTSTLFQLEHELSTREEFIPVYFNLQGETSGVNFDLLYQLSHAVAEVIGVWMADPEVISENEKGYFQRSFLSSALQAAGEKKIVILLDDFDALDNLTQSPTTLAFLASLRHIMAEVKQVRFVYAISKKPEELSSNLLALLKSMRIARLLPLNQEETSALVCQTHENEWLQWQEEAVQRVWQYTHGHPWLSQHLCNQVWQITQGNEKSASTQVFKNHVEQAAENIIEDPKSIAWLWNTLSPEQQMIFSILSEDVTKTSVSRADLNETLGQHSFFMEETDLVFTLESLVEQDLLQVEKKNYQCELELFLNWVAQQHPFVQSAASIDQMDPLAENFYQTGKGFYNLGELDDAESQLAQAIASNPHHIQARLLMGHILTQKQRFAEAVVMLEEVYQINPSIVRDELINALLEFAEAQNSEDKVLRSYERILEIQPDHKLAWEKRSAIWIGRGEAALRKSDPDRARKCFELAQETQRAQWAQLYNLKKIITDKLHTAQQYEQENQLDNAVRVYQSLFQHYQNYETWLPKSSFVEYDRRVQKGEFPDYDISLRDVPGKDLKDRLQIVVNKSQIAAIYARAFQEMQNGKFAAAQTLFYKLLFIATGDNVQEIKQRLNNTTDLQAENVGLKSSLKAAQKKIIELEGLLNIARTNIKEKTSTLEQANQQNTRQTIQLAETQNQLKEAQQRILLLEEKLSNTNSNLTQDREALKETSQKATELEQQIGEALTTLEKQRLQIESSEQQIGALEGELIQTQAALAAMQSDLQDAQDERDDLEQEFEQSQQRIEQLENQFAEAVNMLESEQKKYKNILQKIKLLKKQLNEEKETRSELENLFNAPASDEITTLIMQVAQTNPQEAREGISKLVGQVAALKNMLAEEQKVVHRLREFVNQDARDKNALRKELNTLRKQLGMEETPEPPAASIPPDLDLSTEDDFISALENASQETNATLSPEDDGLLSKNPQSFS